MLKRKFRIAFVSVSEFEQVGLKKLHWQGSNVYFHWRAEDIDVIAKKASKKIREGFIKGMKYDFAAIMVRAEVRGFKFWQEVGVVDENGWQSDISFSSNNI